MLRRDRASMLVLFLSLLCTLLAIGLAFYYLRPPKGPDNGRCLAIALGGSSDIIGSEVALLFHLGLLNRCSRAAGIARRYVRQIAQRAG